MDILKKLKEINLKPLEINKFYYNDNEIDFMIDYIEYRKMYKEIEISRYYIFDINSFKKYNPIKNIDLFVNFQDAFLAKTFFNSPSVLRYNLYMMFIIPNDFVISDEDNSNIDKIEHNLSFARKLFINYDSVITYFNNLDLLKKSGRSKSYDNNKIKTIMKSIRDLDGMGIKSCLTTKLDKEAGKQFLNSIIKIGKEPISFDSKMKNGSMSCTKFFNTYYQIDASSYVVDFELDHIDLIKNMTFRKNVLKFDEVKLKKFNVICGKNATGKTSLLELIELALTGMIHNIDGENEDNDIIIYGKNGHEFTPSKSLKHEIIIKNMWYRGKVGSLNDLFCRINYFDINDAYRFALEFGEKPYQKFLCDYQLLEAKNNLMSYLYLLNNAENNFKPLIKKLSSSNENSVSEISKVLDNVNKYFDVVYGCIGMIDSLLEQEISANMETINLIYKKLDSIYYNIVYDRDTKKLMLNNTLTNTFIGITK